MINSSEKFTILLENFETFIEKTGYLFQNNRQIGRRQITLVVAKEPKSRGASICSVGGLPLH